MEVDEENIDAEKPLNGLKIVCSGEFELVSRKTRRIDRKTWWSSDVRGEFTHPIPCCRL
jgi:hypothetical protein